MHDGQEGPAPHSDAPHEITRRDIRDAPAASALPAAGAVARVHAMSSWSRGRKMLAIGSAIGGIGLIALGVATTGAGDQSALADGPVTTYADRVDPASDEGVPAGTPDSIAETDAPEPGPTTESDPDAPANRPDAGDPRVEEPGGAGTPSSPGTGPGTEEPGTGTPGTTPGTNPGTNPGTSNPGTSNPGTNPGTSPTAPSTPKPLGFAGLTENHTLSLLGIKVLGSYTLSLTGQPGSSASVTYGSASAGTATFDGDGRATVTLGRSLIDLGLRNPTIRVAYSDGTAGSAIEAARDSI
ncbi:hypothetical protein [Streptomyces sp. AC495_CC817]|uniref:hypothetical protein n=1 Tax=Streptomyces sp. AC495_CC817 TaxID=2823900 RepID=UPI001C274514|nr:hypothetical protein [Streptomyces sp. AC495_CC817]